MFSRCRLSGAVGLVRQRPARARRRACARGSARVACGCSSSGTPSAAAAHWRVWSSGVAPMPPQQNTASPLANASRSVGGDARAVVADVARPAQAPGRARASSSITLGRCLSCALAREDLVADDDEAEVHAHLRVQDKAGGIGAPGSRPSGKLVLGTSRHRGPSAGPLPSRPASPRGIDRCTHRRGAVIRQAQPRQRGQRVVGEPERREREHQRVEPDRDHDQHRREDQRQRADGPEQRRRRAEVAAQHAHASSGQRCSRIIRRRSSRLACSASTSKAITR